jgi:L-alanine-DL-glutamate epimerase-like enolase superfamily enzyme
MSCRAEPAVERLETAVYRVPTDQPESDGTLEWDSTTAVVVRAHGGGHTGLGYTYSAPAAAAIIDDELAPVVCGRPVHEVRATWAAMVDAVRNLGWPGMVSCAISAVDVALWDLAARRLERPVLDLLGRVHGAVPAYGSGGFCTYDDTALADQLGGWAAAGHDHVKMKVGRDPAGDRHRLRVAVDAVDGSAVLMVDANGAYDRKQALGMAAAFAEQRVSWFEEPVSSDDLKGLRLVRDGGPAGMSIAAGEYGFDPIYFRRMLEAGAVDVLQADATRCGGITGFLAADGLCDGWSMPLSAHTAPALHVHACCAARRALNLEYFHDHVRIEQLIFDGASQPVDGRLQPDRSRPGLGLELKRRDAERFAT